MVGTNCPEEGNEMSGKIRVVARHGAAWFAAVGGRVYRIEILAAQALPPRPGIRLESLAGRPEYLIAECAV